jgi:PAS domain S-box-containing protein
MGRFAMPGREGRVDSQARAGRDRVVMDALPGLTLGLAVLQAVLALVHATFGSALERPFFFVDAASAALAGGLRFAFGRGAIPERWAHPLAAGCGVVAAVIVLVHLRVLGDPLQGLMLVVVLIGGGSILLSFRWLSLLAGATLLGWLGVMGSLGFPQGSLRIGTALLGAYGLAAMSLSGRLRSFRRLEDLREQNEARLKGDVVEARRVTESLRQSEESHRLLFEKSPLPMWLIERNTLRFLAVNDEVVRHYGYSREEFLEMTLEDIHPPEELARLRADFAAGPQQGTPNTRRHRKKDGAIIDVEIIAHDTTFGSWDALLSVMTDVTERRKSEEALRRSRESFQQLFEEAPIGMAMIGADVGFGRVNGALCAMMEYSKEELKAITFDRFVHPEDLEDHMVAAQEFFEGKRSSFKRDARYLKKSGEALWGSLTVERIDDSSTGEMLFVLGMLEDISERHRAAAERERIIAELTEALANVKTLRGLVPICASCKKIRDDKGYWSQVEVYVRDHTEAEFSHGICPDCMKKLYGK